MFMIVYCCKDIKPLKVNVSKLRFSEEDKKDETLNTRIDPYLFQAKSTKSTKSKKTSKTSKTKKSAKSSKSKKKKQTKSTKESYPPKKGHVRKTRKNSFDEGQDKQKINLVDLMKKKRHSIKNKPQKDDESIKSDKVRRRKSIVDMQQEMIMKTRENLIKDEILDNYNSNKKLEKLKPTEKVYKKYEGIDEELRRLNGYDDYELNNMDYQDASVLDHRSCIRTYWSVIKREHYVIFTFVPGNDYNLFYVKIERFFILICSEMTMNGMFFVHETMYKKKTGDTSFAQRIPQIIFSLLVSHAVEIILCYLGMTDKHYYEIKALPKIKKNDERIVDILKCVRWKLIGFFIFTFLVFLFHWYFISAFCAVYQNTQKIFLRDSGISILVSLIDPFIIYGLTCLLRAISLCMCCRKKLGCVYKLSDIIPFF